MLILPGQEELIFCAELVRLGGYNFFAESAMAGGSYLSVLILQGQKSPCFLLNLRCQKDLISMLILRGKADLIFCVDPARSR